MSQSKEYYGKTLGGADLKTDACCTLDATPVFEPVLAAIHPRWQGAITAVGLLPEAITGLRILDLGCGARARCIRPGPRWWARAAPWSVGYDPEQLAGAGISGLSRTSCEYGTPNTEFHLGYIERLDALALADNSFDLIVSNCVLNLCGQGRGAAAKAHRLLKPGGGCNFPMYADRRIPAELLADPVPRRVLSEPVLERLCHLAKTAGLMTPAGK